MTKAWAGHNLAEQGDGGLFDGRAPPDALRRWERSADAGWRRAVMHSLRDPLVILDPEGAVIEFNQAFTQLFGYELSGAPSGFTPPAPAWSFRSRV
jgi:PAS domain-containing protein